MSKDVPLWQRVIDQIPDQKITFGRFTGEAYLTDPAFIAFKASRYKFVAKMLEGKGSVLEIGCGDGFGAPLVAQRVKQMTCTDLLPDNVAEATARLAPFKNITVDLHDFNESEYHWNHDAACLVDVLEHVEPADESRFMSNVVGSVVPQGAVLIGVPNKTAEQYASAHSKAGHVNLKTHAELRTLGLRYFHNVFMFGMNDEVVHTGYGAMCHYLWMLGVGRR